VTAILTCVGQQHDWRLLALAGFVCLVGMLTTARLVRHSMTAGGQVRNAWAFMAALVSGTSIWTTHFVAMLAYRADIPFSYDLALTMLSLLIAAFGSYLALGAALLIRSAIGSAIGGGLLGLAVVAMHYTGMSALRIDGIIRWRMDYIAASVILAGLLGVVSLLLLRRTDDNRRIDAITIAALMATVLVPHFTGMAAMQLVPAHHAKPVNADAAHVLALSTILAATMIIAAGSFARLIDLRSRKLASDRIAEAALTDPLTGLANRNALMEELRGRIEAASQDRLVTLFAIQIADIEDIRKAFGERFGDRVIRAMASRLEEARRPDVFLAHAGGARFFGSAIMPADADVAQLARTIRDWLNRPMVIEAREIPVDVRIGATCWPHDTRDAEELMQKSQLALAKALGDPLGSVALHDESSATSSHRQIILANGLRGALSRGELRLLYQPQVWIADRRVLGYEALLRWEHPELGSISPAEFIPIAERTGAIIEIGIWALREACREAVNWPAAHRVAVNISPLQLRQPDLPEAIHEALLESGLAPARLEIELTESLLIDDHLRALHVLRRIKALGVRIALDDFGTGYSSMQVLRRFPFDKVKLDKSFVDEVETDPRARAILHAILALGRTLSMPILVEGVETARQLAILRREGCRKVQGFLTGRPMTAQEIAARNVPGTVVELRGRIAANG